MNKLEWMKYPIQVEANNFAMELLMPTKMVQDEAEKMESKSIKEFIQAMADKFEVEVWQMTIKLQSMGFFLIKNKKD